MRSEEFSSSSIGEDDRADGFETAELFLSKGPASIDESLSVETPSLCCIVSASDRLCRLLAAVPFPSRRFDFFPRGSSNVSALAFRLAFLYFEIGATVLSGLR
jgi:hypothetical protein